jgi:CRISPR-associated endonuclease Csn1
VDEDHILPFAVTLDDSFANRVIVMREANRRKARQTPYEAFHAQADWPEIQARAALLPPSKAWRFGPEALEKWKGEHGDFLARHLTDSAYLARLARIYLRAVCDPDQVWCIPGRLTGMLRGALGMDSASLLGKGGARKDRDDHRHHAIDALTIGLVDRSLLQRVATAAGRAQDRGRRLLDDLAEPWPGFLAEAATKVQAIMVSFKADTSPAGRLHNDTAYALLPAAGSKSPNVAHRVTVQALAGWKPEEVREALGDPRLAERVVQVLENTTGKLAQAAALGALPHDATGRTVRRVQVRERLDGTAEIRDRRTGLPYKRVKLDANHRVEFWRLPATDGKPAKIKMLVVSMMEAAADAEATRLKRPTLDRRPHPAAKLLMRLHKYDVVAFGVGEARKLLRVVKFRRGEVSLAELHESGNLKVRDAAKDDPFKYVSASISRFTTERARKVFVDPAGRVFDQGPLQW